MFIIMTEMNVTSTEMYKKNPDVLVTFPPSTNLYDIPLQQINVLAVNLKYTRAILNLLQVVTPA